MAEETLVKEPLTKEMVAAGVALTRSLDAKGIELLCAFWLYNVESGRWQLVFSSPLVDTEGLRKVYSVIQDIMKEEGGQISISLEDIKLLSPNDALIRALQFALKTPSKSISGIRFTRNRINDLYVEDAYIYRVN